MGLSGQAGLPMILGLGCDTMATVTTRTLETGRQRVIATLLLALAVPCSAQMAVRLAMGVAISPWVLVGVVGTAGAEILLVGRLAAKVLPGESAPFVLELPRLRRHLVRNILAKTRLRLQRLRGCAPTRRGRARAACPPGPRERRGRRAS